MKATSRFSGAALFATLLLTFSPYPVFADGDNAVIKRFDLTISERKVQREENTIRVTQGDTVELVWHSDEAAKLHLHGYDIGFEVSPNAPVTIGFKATATGRFPISSHSFSGQQGHAHAALLYVEVYPD